MSEKDDISRSEQVRRRRERENARRMERALREATRAAQSRQESTQPRRRVARTGNTRATGPRRRFPIALLPIAPDAEMRGISLPRRLPRPRLGPRLFSFFIVALLGTAIFLAFNLPHFRVAQAQVIGSQILPAEEISASMEIEGRPVFLLVPSKLETQLRLTYPELVSAKVDVTLPNVVRVSVSERKPVIRWEQGPSYTWISEDGVAFRPRGEVQGLISVQALSAPPAEISVSPDPLTPAPFISPDMVQAIKGLGWHVPPGMTILYDAAFGFGWNDPRGWRVYFGTKASDVELKMRVYESLVNSLTQRGIQPALINVTYPTAPYYRLTE